MMLFCKKFIWWLHVWFCCRLVVEFMLNEADTRIKLIDPKLHESGWGEEFV